MRDSLFLLSALQRRDEGDALAEIAKVTPGEIDLSGLLFHSLWSEKATRALLDKQADARIVHVEQDFNLKGTGLIWFAAESHKSSPAIVKMLIDAGADINAKGIFKRGTCRTMDVPALCVAAHRLNVEMIDCLLCLGADAAATDSEGKSPLLWAIFSTPEYSDDSGATLEKITQMLVAAGLDIDATDKRGMTALHHACSRTGSQAARIMLDAGANPDALALGTDTYTPEKYASIAKQYETIALLHAARARRAMEKVAQDAVKAVTP